MKRKDWDDYWIDIAFRVSERATCDRAHVGSVIIRKDNTIVSTGYNGSPAKKPHCDEVGHLMINGHCKRTRHSEKNAILIAEKYDLDVSGCIIYCTHQPCWNCLGEIIASQISEIKFAKEYGAIDQEKYEKVCKDNNIKVEQVEINDKGN